MNQIEQRKHDFLKNGECGTEKNPHIPQVYIILERQICDCKICAKRLDVDDKILENVINEKIKEIESEMIKYDSHGSLYMNLWNKKKMLENILSEVKC
jgi:hypothetical protein